MNINQIKKILVSACDDVIANESILTKVDTAIGDGDHGISMREGFTELKKYLGISDDKSIFSLFKNCGMTLIKSMGGASGVIFGTLFIGGLDTLDKNDDNIDANTFIRFLKSSAESIKKRGRIDRGDRTMYDSLLCAIDEIDTNKPKDAEELLHNLFIGAEKGKTATEKMLPRIGRSKNFRDKALGFPDPGAMSLTYIFEGLYKGLKNL